MDFFRQNRWWVISFVSAVILYGGYELTLAPPPRFPSGSIVVIVRGTSVTDIAQQLSGERIIMHPTLLRLILRVTGTARNVQTGAYLFEKPENLLVVVYRLVVGAYDIPPARITLVEGLTVREMGAKIAGAAPEIPIADFISAAKPYEGYLFPDTYTFSPGESAESAVALMRANFNTKIASLSSGISTSGHSLSDIVIIASLVEKEARSVENKKIVAGILWSRLKLGMPLQVDAVFGYIFNRSTYSPSPSDLKVDSLYNTYTHKGLPPGPICNPGLDSLKAAIAPTKTTYLYYLTGSDNQMHYAVTYAAHQANQQKYLR